MNYKIKRGDTLSSLARRFGTTVEQLARLNGIKNPNLIYEAKNLFIPSNMEPPSHIPEPKVTNLALAPLGAPARQPIDPKTDAIVPTGFLGGDPVSEVLLGAGIPTLLGKQTGRAMNLADDMASAKRIGTPDVTLDDLYALSKYIKPEQMSLLIKNYKR